MPAATLLAALMLSAFPPDHQVARIAHRVIRYGEIDCSATPDDIEAQARRNGSSIEEQCHRREQERLNTILVRELYEVAFERLDVHVSPAEVANAPAARALTDQWLDEVVRRSRIVPVAALHVLEGANADDVFRRELSTEALTAQGIAHSIRRADFDRYLAFVRTAENANRLLASMNVAEMRRRFLADVMFTMRVQRVGEALATRAAARHVPAADYAERFWTDLMASLQLTITEPRYGAVSPKGVTWPPAPQS